MTSSRQLTVGNQLVEVTALRAQCSQPPCSHPNAIYRHPIHVVTDIFDFPLGFPFRFNSYLLFAPRHIQTRGSLSATRRVVESSPRSASPWLPRATDVIDPSPEMSASCNAPPLTTHEFTSRREPVFRHADLCHEMGRVDGHPQLRRTSSAYQGEALPRCLRRSHLDQPQIGRAHV